MPLWFCEDQEYSSISLENKLLRDRIVNILGQYTKEMEGYSYFGSNPGIEKDDYEDIAEELMTEFKLWENKP